MRARSPITCHGYDTEGLRKPARLKEAAPMHISGPIYLVKVSGQCTQEPLEKKRTGNRSIELIPLNTFINFYEQFCQ